MFKECSFWVVDRMFLLRIDLVLGCEFFVFVGVDRLVGVRIFFFLGEVYLLEWKSIIWFVV